MPVLDDRYVRHLQDFTKALDGVVELLVEDSKKKNVDSVDKMLTNMNEDLRSVVKNMEIVMKSTKKIETQNDKILEEIRASRKAKETGMFGNIADVDNKRKILDAVKVITLIAAGIIAIGLAFKLIAPVPVLSIIAIGLAIVFIAGAFVMVAAVTEGMDQKDVGRITGMMVTMSLALMVSSWILAFSATITLAKAMSILFVATSLGGALAVMAYAIEKSKIEPKDYPKFLLIPLVLPIIALGLTVSSIILSKMVPLTFMQMVTTVFVAAAIGSALFFIAKALDKTSMEKKHVGQFLLLPIIVPALALGLVAASWILKGIMPISFSQMISAVFTAVTIGVLVYLMKPMIEKLKDLNLTQVILAGALIVALSAGLVAASWVLSGMRLMGWKESLLLVVNSLAIGLAILFLTPAVYLLKKIEKNQMIQAATNIVILAGAIAVSSILLSIGMYDNVPDWEWAIGAGLSITAFAGAVWALKKMDLDYKDVFKGSLMILGISATIMLTSRILSLGNYDDYPSLGWSLGVGLSLVAFGGSMFLISKYIKEPTELFDGALVVLGVALVIALVSQILAKGNYDEYPDIDWAVGVGLSIVAFGGTMALLGIPGALELIALGFVGVILVASTIVVTSYILGAGDYSSYPDIDWAKGVGLSLITFSITMALMGLALPLLLLGSISILLLAKVIVTTSNILSDGDYGSGPTVEWAAGTGALLIAVGLSTILFAGLLPFILLGGMAMLLTASAIVSVAEILAQGDYTGGPTEEWAKGVSLSIKAFAESIAALNEGGGLFGMLFGSDQTDMIRSIAQAMVDASYILKGGDWTSYPPAEWSKGVADSIFAFAKGIAALEEADVEPGVEFIWVVSALAYGIIEAAKILNEFDWSNIKNYPKAEWAKGVGEAINAFARPLAELGKADVTGRDITKGIKRLSQGLVDAAEIIGDYDWSKVEGKYPSRDWAVGVGDALKIFVDSLVKIEKADVGRGDLRILRATIKAMIAAAEDFADVDEKVWGSYPPEGWSDGVGSALATFVKYLVDIEKKDIGKGEIRNLNRVIDSMIDAAKNFAEIGDDMWATGPTSDWGERIGNSLNVFVTYLSKIEKADIGRGEIRNLNRIISSMIHAAERFAGVDSDVWLKGPPPEWSQGVGNAIGNFVKFLEDIEKADLGDDIGSLYRIIRLMINTAHRFADVDPNVWKNGPPIEWSQGIEIAVNAFVTSIERLSALGDENFHLLSRAGWQMLHFAWIMSLLEKRKDLFEAGGIFDTFSEAMKKLTSNLPTMEQSEALKTLSDALTNISSMGMTASFSIWMLSRAMTNLGESLKEIDMSEFDKLSKFSNGILVLSLIDEKKFEEALSVINKKKDDIKAILSDNAGTIGRTETVAGATTLEEAQAAEAQASAVDDQKKFYSDLLSYVQNLDSNVGKILEKIPTDTGGASNDKGPGKPDAVVGSQQTNPTK